MSFWKDVAIILASVVTVVTFFTGFWEYRRKLRQDRAQMMLEMRRRFLETAEFQQILEALIADDPALRQVPIQQRRHFAGFLEEVALLANSGLIRREVALYLFGFYVLRAAESDAFWDGLDRESVFWAQFRRFAEVARTTAARMATRERSVRI